MKFVQHTYEVEILEHHLDTFGHVNNATYLEILEEARWNFITHRGYGLDKVQSTGLGPIILDIHIRFRKELLLRETVTIHTQTKSYKGKIAKIAHEIKDQNGNVCAEAEFTFGLFDTKSRKLVLPTDEWLHAIGVNKS